MKEKSNTGLVILIIFLFIALICLSLYILWDKNVISNDIFSETNQGSDSVTENNQGNVNVDEDVLTEGKRIGWAFGTSTGLKTVPHTKTGTYIFYTDNCVYFIPQEEFNGIKITLPQNIGIYGVYNTADVYTTTMLEPEYNGDFSGYKLELNDIKAGYVVELDNNTNTEHILFLGRNGRLSELKYEVVAGKLNVELEKDIEGYRNIVNVFQTVTNGQKYVKVVDKDGNIYNYYGKNSVATKAENGQEISKVYVHGTEVGIENLVVTEAGEVLCTTTGVDLSSCAKKQDGKYILNLSNIVCAVPCYFGNGASLASVLFIDKSGNVSELLMQYKYDSGKVEAKLEKNVSGYSNIVSAVQESTIGGNGVVVIDKNGNEFNYRSISL